MPGSGDVFERLSWPNGPLLAEQPYKIEKGNPGVSLGNYANVLFVLGMAERLGDLADVKTDTVGLGLEEERLPQRIRKPRQNKSRRMSSQSG